MRAADALVGAVVPTGPQVDIRGPTIRVEPERVEGVHCLWPGYT
jgi:hypothetical protein